MNEHLLSQLWRGQAFERGVLPCADGSAVQVVYRGRPNPHDGPDFVDAIVAMPDGTLRGGDVELHVRTRDWRGHGHHGDPRFNAVILHVVWEDDGSNAIRQDGVVLPTAVLGALPQGRAWEMGALALLAPPQVDPCRRRAQLRGSDDVGAALDAAGEQRFLSKAAVLEGELACRPAEEVLYAGLMEALGYSRNREPFRRLAQALPRTVLSGFAAGKPEPEKVVLALLLGTAGLLPARQMRLLVPPGCAAPESAGVAAEDAYEESLLEIWARSALRPALSPSSWQRARVRPENLPARRLAGMAVLLTRSAAGLLESVLEILRQEPSCAPGALRRFCEARGDGYWSSHLEPGRPLSRPVPSLIGPGRAAEMVVNVLLPFGWAYGQHTADDLLSQRAITIYRLHAATESNHITRQMTDQIWVDQGGQAARSALRQQGLLHIFSLYCRQRRCDECPVARRPA